MTDNTDRELLELAAKALYETWHSQPEYKPWQDGGNSHKQDEARELVRLAAHKLKPPLPEQEDFCFCHDGVSLQIVSGGAAPEGYLGKVTLLIDGKYVDYVKAQPVQRKPLTDEQVKKLLLIAPVYAPDGVVTRTPFAYRKELLDTALWALRKAEAAHGIKEQP
jgi:hypothetical protein